MKLTIRSKERILFLKQAGWIKLFGYYLSYKSPKSEPLFSERNGYQKPFLKIKGWRFFLLDALGRTENRGRSMKIVGTKIGRWSSSGTKFKSNITEFPKRSGEG